MRTSEEIKARLQHGAQQIREVLQLLAASSDCIQTTFEEIRVCHDRANLIDPVISELSHQIQTLTEDMDRVYSLRNDESDLYLKQENKNLKRDLAALQQALRHETDEHQAHLTNSVKSNEELVQRIQTLERFNHLLKTKINEMKEQYDGAIIDLADQRDTIACLRVTVKSLQSTPAFSVIANTAASGDSNCGAPTGPIPFGKTVVETNRGLTVTIESSPDSSPEKASLHHGWIPQVASDTTAQFPDIVPQPQSMNLTPTNQGSTQIAIGTPGKSKGRGIVKGTPEANESFQRMKCFLNSSPLANFTNIISIDKNTTAASSSSALGFAMPIIRSDGVHPVTPSQVRSKLNPAVEAFTPSNSSGKESAKTGRMQASPPSKNEFNPWINATTAKEEEFSPPHLRRLSKISAKEEPVITTEELSVKDRIKDQGNIATIAQNESTKESEPLQPTSLTPSILPHLRRLPNVIKDGEVDPSQVQHSSKAKDKDNTIEGIGRMSGQLASTKMKENVKAAITPLAFVRPKSGLQAWLDSQEQARSNNASANDSAAPANDTLIEFDPGDSPKAGEKMTVPLPPGFIPISANDAPVKTEADAPTKTNRAVSPTAAHDRVPYRNPFIEDEAAALWQEVSAQASSENKTASEKEKNAAFVLEYNRKLSSISDKYGRDSRKGSDAKGADEMDPVKYAGAEASHLPSERTGTHKLGALLDDECYSMVFKPRKAANVAGVGQEWKAAVRKDGKVVYVL